MLRRPILFTLAPLSAVAALLLTLSPAGATPNHHAVKDTRGTCHVATHIRQLSTHRTKNSAVRTQRVTVTTRGTACRRLLQQLSTHRAKNSMVRTQHASASAPRILLSCLLHEKIVWRASIKQLHGEAWTDTCNGAIECFQTAELQEESPPDPGTWFTIKEAAQTEGCIKADESKTNRNCHTILVTRTYRTLGIFVIFWDDGTHNPFHGHTSGLTIHATC